MEITDYMLNVFVSMINYNDPALKGNLLYGIYCIIKITDRYRARRLVKKNI